MNENTKFKVGDTVVIKSGIEQLRRPGDPGLNDDMIAMAGQRYIVETARLDSWSKLEYYHLENSHWTWIGDWLDVNPEFYENTEFDDIHEEDVMTLF